MFLDYKKLTKVDAVFSLYQIEHALYILLDKYGSFTILFVSNYPQEISVSFTIFINNTETIDSFVPECVIHESASSGTFLMFENIWCNNAFSFLGLIMIDTHEKLPIDVLKNIRSNQVSAKFGCPLHF